MPAYDRRVAGHLLGLPLGAGLAHLLEKAAASAVGLWFDEAVHLAARTDLSTLEELWKAVSATTEPVLTGPNWQSELELMSILAATVMLPLVCLAALSAILRQDASGLVRTALVRVPLALVFTGVAVELVSLGLAVTDQACKALMEVAGRSLHGLFLHMTAYLGLASLGTQAVNVFCLVVSGFFAFVVWIELATRAAAVAVATLFLPLALAGSAFPATAHWGRRLAETLAALVLSKLVIVAVLALAAGTLTSSAGGLSALVEGTSLLGLAAVAPLALGRMLPMVEAGAVAHLDGLGRRALGSAAGAAASAHGWIGASSGRGGPPPEGSGVEGPPGVDRAATGLRPPQPPTPAPTPAPAGPPGSHGRGGPDRDEGGPA
ncbi:MAG TPA: hypothetical protein VFN50_09395 [Acidimicrobiales bacterium]|nr:hypothetical protein [Acidimicrobiales bacterium]